MEGATSPVTVDWLLESRVQRLYADLRGEPKVVIGARFTLLDSRSTELDVVFRKDYGVTRAAPGQEPAQLVEAWTEAWSAILTSLEADLRAHFAEAAPSS